ncbi:flocculation protein FLO11-like [Cucumis melo var. makuwa]|uniref:Flocculation protein FLO11-like n=1 Tax=Cucumis melo var. makuwa TaxID=1194695 RepID=A0A5A7UXI2_CUCMM|nr:flocculation protein FLO11-like [Cucumis melo var. makuwa]TYK24884.1 flocculation protein FLO11-like [Cucumis melo var. makuwa]
MQRTLSKFGMDKARPKRTPAATHLKMTKDKNDWAGCTDDRKSTSGGCFFLGNNIATWFSKKQNNVSLSTAEAEYIVVGSSCSQLLWMKQMLDEYGITPTSMILYCDNLSAISIFKNPVQHSQTKHIDIRHHFIRELVEANIIRLEHVQSAFQLADIFTKPLDVATFEGLRASVGVCQRPTKYSSDISSSKNPSAYCSSEAMDPTAPKSTTSSKGKQYKGIPTKHLYKKVRKSIPSVKEEILEFSSPQSVCPYVSSSIPKSSLRPEPRVSVETVVLDSYSSDIDDNVAPPRPSEHTKYSDTPSSQASPKTAPPCEADDEDDDSDDEDYAPGTEEKTEAEAMSTSTENQSASLEKDPSDHQSTEESGESSIPRSTEGPRAHKWKHVVKQRIANEANIADQYNFCLAILELIRNAELIRTVSKVGPFYPRLMRELIVNLPSDFNDPSADEYQKVHIRGVCFNVSPDLLNSYLGITLSADYAVSYPTLERLAEELTGGTILAWPVDGQLQVASLTVKYSILHRIGTSNWIQSMHTSTISTLLGHFVYLVGTRVKVNVGEFIFNHLLRNVDTFAIHIPICFPRILSGFILAQQSTIMTPLDIVGSAPQVIPLSMRLFQGTHFPDVAVEFDNALGGTSTSAASQPAVGHPVTLSVSLANRLLQALIAESHALTHQINELTNRRTVLDAVIRDLRCAAFGTTPPPSD